MQHFPDLGRDGPARMRVWRLYGDEAQTGKPDFGLAPLSTLNSPPSAVLLRRTGQRSTPFVLPWAVGSAVLSRESLTASRHTPAGRTEEGRRPNAEGGGRARPPRATHKPSTSHLQAIYKPCAWEGVATLKPSTGGNNDHSCAGCASWTIVALLCQKSSRSSIVGPS
jgi:hypothetical protein